MFAIVPGIISIIAPPAPIAVPVPLDVLTGMPPDTAPTPVFEVLTGTPEADIFELDVPGFGTLNDLDRISVIDFFGQPGVQSLDDNFIVMGIDFENRLIAYSNQNNVDATTDNEVDLLVYQEVDGPEYFPGFTDPLARSYTLIENFDPIEDQILVDGGKGYVRIMSDEIIAGESSNDVADFLIMGNTTIDFEDFHGGGDRDFDDQILPIDFRLV